MRNTASVAIALAALAVFAFTACGQKGPLVLPAKPAASAPPAPAASR